MLRTPSRRERRESKFYSIAEKGGMYCDNVSLFLSEAKDLRKKGLFVERHGPEKDKNSLPSLASWEEAFEEIPLIVNDYITGIIDTFPSRYISNWAQELYVIAARARHNKGTNK